MPKNVIQWLTGEVRRLAKEVASLRDMLELPAPEEPKVNTPPKVQSNKKRVRKPVDDALRTNVRVHFTRTLNNHPSWTAYRCASATARKFKRNQSTVIRILGDAYTDVNQSRGNRFQEAAE